MTLVTAIVVETLPFIIIVFAINWLVPTYSPDFESTSNCSDNPVRMS